MAVDGGVAAAVDDAAAVRRDLEPVAVAPDAAGTCRSSSTDSAALPASSQKYSGIDGIGCGADQLADLVDHRLALLVPGLDRAAEQAALHLARHLRQLAVAADEGAGEVGAAGDVAPPDVSCACRLRLRTAAVPQCCTSARAASRCVPSARTRRQVAAGGESTPAFMQLAKNAAPAPKKVTPVSAAKRHSVVQSGWSCRSARGRVAVEDAAGGAAQQAGRPGVPHDPAGGAVPVIALAERVGVVAAADVVVQRAQRAGHDDVPPWPCTIGLGRPVVPLE